MNEVISVDLLELKADTEESHPAPQQTIQLYQIAKQVNDLASAVIKLTSDNQKLVKQLDDLRNQHK